MLQRLIGIIFVSLFVTAAWAGEENGASGGIPFEESVLMEMNELRLNPKKYMALLQEMLPHFKGNLLEVPGEPPVMTREGEKSMKEAIKFLKKAKPLPPLSWADGLGQAARDHVRDQGEKGTRGHGGSDQSGPVQRISRYGIWKTRVGENISYGMMTPRKVVLQLLIDDGVKNRGHRKVLFNPLYSQTGIACGDHRVLKTMCVIDYAAEFTEGFEETGAASTSVSPFIR